MKVWLWCATFVSTLTLTLCCSCLSMTNIQKHCKGNFTIRASVSGASYYRVGKKIYPITIHETYKPSVMPRGVVKTRVYTPPQDAQCGVTLRVGQTYILSGRYLTRTSPWRLGINLCGSWVQISSRLSRGDRTCITKQYRCCSIFADGMRVGTVTSHSISEASGICMSRVHKNVLYTHNDSGGTHRIFALDATTGHRISTITINGAAARDWEDIACGVCPGDAGKGAGTKYCIYIADTGDLGGRGAADIIYRIQEPASLYSDTTVILESYLKFSWDQEDCETLLVDSLGEIYVVSKVHQGGGKLVHLPSSAWGQQHRTHVDEGVVLPLQTEHEGPLGGDISPNGHEVLIKTYNHVMYWLVPDGDYYKHMSIGGIQVRYHHERQGEAVCWDDSGSGYYTLGEGHNSPLYYYTRLQSPVPAVG